jgi:hypothetical protein
MSTLTEKTALVSYHSLRYDWCDECVNTRCCPGGESAVNFIWGGFVSFSTAVITLSIMAMCEGPDGNVMANPIGGTATLLSLGAVAWICFQKYRFKCGATPPEVREWNTQQLKSENCARDTMLIISAILFVANAAAWIMAATKCNK